MIRSTVKVCPDDIIVYQGKLYERVGEDGVQVVANWYIGATIGPEDYILRRCFEPMNRSRAEALASLIRQRGEIDLKHWDCVDAPTIEERLGPGGIEWALEQEERWLFR
jgi:hypothetical protein